MEMEICKKKYVVHGIAVHCYVLMYDYEPFCIIIYALYYEICKIQGEGGEKMKLSARNILKGKVVSVNPGMVNTEIVLELPGGTQIVSIISKESAERLGLAPGKEAHAVIKASTVMIAAD